MVQASTLAETEAHLDNDPQIAAVMKRHNLTSSDMVLLPMATMNLSMLVDNPRNKSGKGLFPASAQIAFYRLHKTELVKMRAFSTR